MNDNDGGRALGRAVFGACGSSGVNAGRAVMRAEQKTLSNRWMVDQFAFRL